jgi:hypothetical protein
VPVAGDGAADDGAAVTVAQGGTGSLPTCPSSSVGARTTQDSYRQTLPWSFGRGDPVDTGDPQSECAPADATSSDPVACTGMALVRSSDAGMALTFGDGSYLLWDESLVPLAVAPVSADDGAIVWVSYAQQVVTVCATCEPSRSRKLEIRNAPGGQLLWFGEEGHELAPMDAALLEELFGVGVHYEAACVDSSPSGACAEADLVEFDVVLETDPEQVVRRGERADVTTPKGEFEVVWAASETTRRAADANCVDSPALTEDRGFAASRRR